MGLTKLRFIEVTSSNLLELVGWWIIRIKQNMEEEYTSIDGDIIIDR